MHYSAHSSHPTRTSRSENFVELGRERTYRVLLYSYPPFAYAQRGEQGSADFFQGFAVDLWKEVARNLSMRCHYTVAPWNRTVDLISSGLYDIVATGGSITRERYGQTVGFTTAIWYGGIGVLLHKERASLTSTEALVRALGTGKIWNAVACLVIGTVLAGLLFWRLERKEEQEEGADDGCTGGRDGRGGRGSGGAREVGQADRARQAYRYSYGAGAASSSTSKLLGEGEGGAKGGDGEDGGGGGGSGGGFSDGLADADDQLHRPHVVEDDLRRQQHVDSGPRGWWQGVWWAAVTVTTIG